MNVLQKFYDQGKRSKKNEKHVSNVSFLCLKRVEKYLK